MKTTTVLIKYADCTLQVTGTYTAGRVGTMEEPPQYPEFEVDKVDLIDGDLISLIDDVYYKGIKKQDVWQTIGEIALHVYENELSDLQEWIEK